MESHNLQLFIVIITRDLRPLKVLKVASWQLMGELESLVLNSLVFILKVLSPPWVAMRLGVVYTAPCKKTGLFSNLMKITIVLKRGRLQQFIEIIRWDLGPLKVVLITGRSWETWWNGHFVIVNFNFKLK